MWKKKTVCVWEKYTWEQGISEYPFKMLNLTMLELYSLYVFHTPLLEEAFCWLCQIERRAKLSDLSVLMRIVL